MAEWIIKHLEHDGTPLAEFTPENLSFTWNLGKVGPHEVSYEASLSNPDLAHGGSPTFVPSVGPYRTDFELWRGSRLLIAGMHTGVSQDGVEDDSIKINGKSWLHYLQRRRYPTHSFVDWQKAVVDGGRAGNSFGSVAPAPRYWTNTDMGTILRNMAEETRDIDIYSLDFTTDIPLFGLNLITYAIEIGDTEKIYDKFVSLSNSFAELGFDFDMSNSKVLNVYPQEYDIIAESPQTSTDPIWGWDGDEVVADEAGGFVDVKFTNNGPEGTHAMGSGSLGSSRQVVNAHYEINSDVFRRLDMEADVLDIIDDPQSVDPLFYIKSQVKSAVSFGANPVHEIELILNPLEISTFWNTAAPGFWPGRYLYLKRDLLWHRINSLQKIVSIKVDVTNEGDETATVGLNQFYVINPDDGINEP